VKYVDVFVRFVIMFSCKSCVHCW